MQNSRPIILGVILILAVIAALAFHMHAERPEERGVTARDVVSSDFDHISILKLYAYDPRLDTDADGNIVCSEKGLVAVERKIPGPDATPLIMLDLLFKGSLTEEERALGLTTEFPLEGVELDTVTSDDGIMTIGIRDPNHKLSGGACRISILRAQIEATAKQFQGVLEVRFAPEGILEP
jgi:hypothetical protein